jgi:predicted RNA-binding protein Jag
MKIINNSSRPRDNLTRAEREALNTLKKITDLTILPADKDNATVILNTADYKQKITSLLEDPSYRRVARDPTDSTE